MKINASEIRVGMLLEHKNDLWQVLKTQHVKPGKGGAFAQVELKSENKNTKLKIPIAIENPFFLKKTYYRTPKGSTYPSNYICNKIFLLDLMKKKYLV